MDLLRSLGSAAVSSIVQRSGYNLPCSLSEKIDSFDGKTIWTLWEGVKRDDNTPVSVFVFEATTSQQRNLLPLAKNALRKLRTVRHPDVLKFIDAVETDNTIYIITERVQPLGKTLHSWSTKSVQEREDWLIWGLHRISVALAFVNDSCTSTHGNVQVDSIFISPSGEWRLGGFELLSTAKDENPVIYTLGGILPNSSKYASPEVLKGGWSALKEHHPSVADAYALGLLVHSVFDPTHPLPTTAQPPSKTSRGSIPKYIFLPYIRLLNPTAKVRLSPAGFLEMGMAQTGGENSGFFVNNRLVKICVGLDNFSLSNEAEKTALLSSLKESASSLPPEFASHRVLPSLVSALEFGGASANIILPLVLQLGVNVSPKDYAKVVITPVIKLYASPDRGTRMALLDHLSEYAEKLDKSTVSEKIWPNLQTGFTDTVPVIREATVKAIGLLSSKLTDRILNNELLRNLAKMQTDSEPSIRTNTCILIGRLAPSLGYNTKRKVLVPAFSRALRDPFVHARVAGLMAFMATVECFEIEEVATKVIPSMSFTLVDKEKLVRDQAFKALELLVKSLEQHVATMPETAAVDNEQVTIVSPTALGGQGNLVNSAAGAAGALAGWAMTSLSKKLVAGDLQSTITSATIDRPISAPITPAAPSLNGRPATLTHTQTLDSTLSPPGLSSAPHTATASSFAGRAKGMQLGASKKVPGSFAAASSLIDELEDETDAMNAWGNDDLMDVHADAGDWSAFETAPDVFVAPKPVSGVVGLGFGNMSTAASPPMIDLRLDEKENPWSDFDAPSEPSKKRYENNAWQSTTNTSTLSMKPPSTPSITVHRSLSPSNRPTPSASPAISESPVPSMASMSKEEKAAEMARRREERKQRIAQLKEQKKAAPPKT